MQPREVVHPLRDLKKQCQILGPKVQVSLWPAEVEAAVLIQFTFRVFARVTPKMLARFINAHSAEPALPPLPKISEAPIEMAGAYLRRILAHRTAERAKRRCGIHPDRNDKTDSLERRARDMFGMHGDKDCSLQLLRQRSGCRRPLGRHHMMGLINQHPVGSRGL